jgi:hypothetical protein
MMFIPTESLITGLFIVAVTFFIITAALQISNLFADDKLEDAIHTLLSYNNWIARIFLVLALAAGISSSFIPI